MKISAFSYVHNGIEGGYPFREAVEAVRPFVDEVVVVDAASTDGTRDALQRLGVRILDDAWGREGGETLARLFRRHVECEGDVIIWFEADEVFDPFLVSEIVHSCIRCDILSVSVHRIQVEQNFQRVRWYPWPVHRVFVRGYLNKVGATTSDEAASYVIEPEAGLLWDCANCFRDNWLLRVKNQAQLMDRELNLLHAPFHVNESVTIRDVDKFLAEPHWTWRTSPLALPDVLKPLVGVTRYEP